MNKQSKHILGLVFEKLISQKYYRFLHMDNHLTIIQTALTSDYNKVRYHLNWLLLSTGWSRTANIISITNTFTYELRLLKHMDMYLQRHTDDGWVPAASGTWQRYKTAVYTHTPRKICWNKHISSVFVSNITHINKQVLQPLFQYKPGEMVWDYQRTTISLITLTDHLDLP